MEPVRVYCDGCFDLVHYGHANSLRQAKEMGDVLVVGVHNDAEIEANKGPPVFTEEERYEMVRAIKWVDEVVEGAPYSADAQFLNTHNCDFATHGDDLSITINGTDAYAQLKRDGLLSMLLLTKTHHQTGDSTTDSPVQEVGVKRWAWSTSKTGAPKPIRITQFLPTVQKMALFADGRTPEPNDRIVYVSGDFDLLHPGHLAFLKAAAAEGDYLIVGIHSDLLVNEKKGGNYPIMNLYERSLSLLACRYVSEVILAAPYEVTEDLMQQYNISVVCHGSTTPFLGPDGADPYDVPKKAGKFHLIYTGNTLTTTQLVTRIIHHRLKYEARNLAKQMREEKADDL